ncbi:response regulator [Zunongwangia sp.]|uniref:response regulator n=1 Tax=Zunongwangia sp. TaxID=1965325 RepID=UPI003AA7DBBA
MKKSNITCIIDDDPIFVFTAKKIMELADFSDSFLVFKNGKEAINHFTALLTTENTLPDVILLDINMPVMNGWEFLDEFTKIESLKSVVIYVVSSSIDPEDKERAKSYEEVSNYVVKPITIDSLKTIIENHK